MYTGIEDGGMDSSLSASQESLYLEENSLDPENSPIERVCYCEVIL